MKEILESSVEFPTIVFTVLLGVSVLYWLISIFVSGGFDADVDLDIDSSVDGAEGNFAQILDTIGLTGVPLPVTITLISLFGWATSLIVMSIVGSLSGAAVLLGVVILIFAFVVGVAVAAFFARPLSKVFTSTPMDRSANLVGKIARVRTANVSPTFGQAEILDNSGSTFVIEVRSEPNEQFSYDDQVIVYEHNATDGVFMVTSFDGLKTS